MKQDRVDSYGQNDVADMMEPHGRLDEVTWPKHRFLMASTLVPHGRHDGATWLTPQRDLNATWLDPGPHESQHVGSE